MICPTCGNNIPENQVNCPVCGSPLRNAAMPPQYNGYAPAPQKNSGNRGLLITIIVLASLLLLLGLGFAIYALTSDKDETKSENIERVETKLTANPADNEKGFPSSLHLNGSIGGDYGASMEFTGESGTYTFMNMTRRITVDSYDEASGKLVVSGYDRNSGQYIGKFDGTLSGNGGSYTYSGRFTNYRGVSLNFSLSN